MISERLLEKRRHDIKSLHQQLGFLPGTQSNVAG
jgi:hypothetical protein